MVSDRPPGGAPVPAGGTSDAFFARVYDELRTLAHARMRGEQSGQSLQTTELVHEAYLRLRPGDGSEWKSRGQFFAAAAQAMRRILIDRARARSSAKRGGSEGRPPSKLSLNLEEVAAIADEQDPETILTLDRAIEKLALHDERAAQIVRLRFWAGLSVEEAAEVLGASTRTILRDWAFARVWLYGELSKG
jgi:RNA polymerase sigma factor (TIGR02999 family)